VVIIPTNKPLVRDELRDAVYKTERAKFKAALDEIQHRNELGQPVLVGTISVEKSEMLSKMLKRQGIPHEVLNAVNHAREAYIIAQAGRKGAVTISTNMAGRGTDIILGGNPELLVEERLLRQFGKKPHDLDEEQQEQWKKRRAELLEKAIREAESEREQVLVAGGLHVLGTERHESRRIDNQLRGRSGRQGDPGSSQFIVSLEDDLMRLFGSDNIASLMDRFGMDEEIPIDHPLVSGAIERAQKKVESRNFEIRRHLIDYDDVLNQQREVIYGQRRRVLEGEEMRQPILEMIEEVIDRVVREHFADKGYLEEQEISSLLRMGEDFFLRRGQVTPQELPDLEQEEVSSLFRDEAEGFYDAREKELGPETMRELERVVLLRTVDRHWMQFIDDMHRLRHEIYLQAYGQRDPIVQYRLESYNMFEDMRFQIQKDVVRAIYQLRVVAPPQRRAVTGPTAGLRPRVASVGGGSGAAPASQSASKPAPAQPVTVDKVGRNEPCPCGSGKKHKKCCGQ
jgi:preprotein translocase subunit SecA